MDRRRFLAFAAAALHAESEPGFTPLFDGVSLNGWSVREGPQSAFHVRDGAITVHPSSNFPAWLRSSRQFENFDFRGEFFLKGWMDSGIYLHAPEHGRNTWCGFEIKLFHQQEDSPSSNSCGAVFPLVAPKSVNVRNKAQWNSFRIVFDWPMLQVWINDQQVQNLDVEQHPELRYRLRKGYLGFQSLSYPIQFRALRIRELPSKQNWLPLFENAADLANWSVSEGKPVYEAVGNVLRLEGLGHIQYQRKFRDFELQTYIRTSRAHNGGIIFRSSGGGTRAPRNYEIQLHNVEGAHFPTGSLYHHKRATYPRIQDEKWYLFQLIAKARNLVIRINGDNVLEYDRMDNLDEGVLELQAHHMGTWCEFKQMRIREL